MATIGLIAGGGRFPLLFAESAHRAGHRVVAIAHRNETDPALADAVDAITWVKLGQLGHLLEALKAGGAAESVMLGAITKRRFFADAMLDATGLKVLARVAIRSDDNLLRAIARFLEEEGVPIADPTPYLADRLARPGVMGRHAPTAEELEDARYGLELARGIGRLDLGQTVVVKDRIALAVEALEGTDACIRRGGELARSGGFVVVKAVKPNQDRRFDLPAVGPDTLDALREAKARVLAVEAGATLMMDLAAMVERADRAKIVLLGVE
ncbi:LpxI family protein [Anaeromyxobacter oryzisoli]|uniref:LpxI family protein n=1 Tax=Anaeromyxobacter oryzisoli TaxID=2925408 RepID=UPI001F56B7F6|nr:UDP-2,3-diacylglucosamine diphosphatase LpxI [Anaeromyxobacter sp. SG63]